MAERAGLSHRGISDLERGQRRNPQPATVRRLAEALALEAFDRAQLHAAVKTSGAAQPTIRWLVSSSESNTTYQGRQQPSRLLRRHPRNLEETTHITLHPS